MTSKNNRASLLCHIKLCASFHSHLWIQTRFTVQKHPNWGKFVLTSVTLTFDLWPGGPFAWTSLLSMVTTTDNFIMIWWQGHSEKGVTERQTSSEIFFLSCNEASCAAYLLLLEGRKNSTIHRAAWSQLKISCMISMAAQLMKTHNKQWNLYKAITELLVSQNWVVFYDRVSKHAFVKTVPYMCHKTCLLTLTHWPLGDLNEILDKQFLNWFQWLVAEASFVKLPSDECHWTLLKSTLVQVMAWCRQATSHYLSQCWLSSLSLYGIAGPQWVKQVLLCNPVQNQWVQPIGFHKFTRLFMEITLPTLQSCIKAIMSILSTIHQGEQYIVVGHAF